MGDAYNGKNLSAEHGNLTRVVDDVARLYDYLMVAITYQKSPDVGRTTAPRV